MNRSSICRLADLRSLLVEDTDQHCNAEMFISALGGLPSLVSSLTAQILSSKQHYGSIRRAESRYSYPGNILADDSASASPGFEERNKQKISHEVTPCAPFSNSRSII